MLDLSKITEFVWDQGNVDKSYQKHGITPNQAEELFSDKKVLLVEDIKHSQKEKRFIAIGKTIQSELLFAAFTVRNNKIRVISARFANRKERGKYEQET